eukprot:Seg1370.13 transcript_id=Seg1370.13/GoldUCD/mRNA.D3Y31 product="von Hippel-Lindau disease tumor suppressor" protein_id=Seg1370.13/GoldUCD/D3Y31
MDQSSNLFKKILEVGGNIRFHSPQSRRKFIQSKRKTGNERLGYPSSPKSRLNRLTSKSTTDSGSELDDQNAAATTRQGQPLGQVRAGLRSLSSDKPVRVKFVNHSGREVQLYWINYHGECEKAFKIADGKSEIIDTYESHPWVAANARNRKVHHAFTVNSNLVYYPTVGVDGGRYSVAEIRKAPEKLTDLLSKPSDIAVTLKFVNRTSRAAFIECIDYEGNRELRQTIEAGKEWTVSTFEQTYWVATANRETDEGLLVNYGWFYSPKKSKSKRERVIITDYI